jgi:hypothetical protein
MNREEHKFIWEMAQYAKSHGGTLKGREFLGRTHPYKWKCSGKHIFYAVFWELKEQEYFCLTCKKLTAGKSNT